MLMWSSHRKCYVDRHGIDPRDDCSLLIFFSEVNTYGLLTKCAVNMAGSWPSSVFACLWTETESRSTNPQKKNEDNFQPS